MLKRFWKPLAIVAGAGTLMVATTGGVFAQEAGPSTSELAASLDATWLLVAAFLVFFMQAGFALLAAGLTRSKNTVNIMMKSLLDFCITCLLFWMVGWGIAYGASQAGFFGTDQFFLDFMPTDPAAPGVPALASWLFQIVFAGTAATIVSGAMAERTKFIAYLIYCVVIGALIYPVVVHWVWSGAGWLNTYSGNTTDSWGFTDFAGSTVVHSVGGWAALVGAFVLGPRIGKFGKDGKAQPIAGQNVVLTSLGVFILWLGWYGFNPGSQLAIAGVANTDAVSLVAVNTTLAAAAGAVAAMITSWIKVGKPDLGHTYNGVLAGLVAITAGCAYVTPLASVIIGLVAGPLVIFAVDWMDLAKIDDPVGAVPVHLVNGVWGTLAVGLFASLPGNTGTLGLFNGGGFTLLIAQLVGILAVAVWTVVTCAILFYAIKFTVGIRVSEAEELEGLDLGEHGAPAYPELSPAPVHSSAPVGGVSRAPAK